MDLPGFPSLPAARDPKGFYFHCFKFEVTTRQVCVCCAMLLPKVRVLIWSWSVLPRPNVAMRNSIENSIILTGRKKLNRSRPASRCGKVGGKKKELPVLWGTRGGLKSWGRDQHVGANGRRRICEATARGVRQGNLGGHGENKVRSPLQFPEVPKGFPKDSCT